MLDRDNLTKNKILFFQKTGQVGNPLLKGRGNELRAENDKGSDKI